MDKFSALNRSMLEQIKPGQTKFFPLEDKTCLNRCRATIHHANNNWIRSNVERYSSHWDKDTCILTVEAVRKQ